MHTEKTSGVQSGHQSPCPGRLSGRNRAGVGLLVYCPHSGRPALAEMAGRSGTARPQGKPSKASARGKTPSHAPQRLTLSITAEDGLCLRAIDRALRARTGRRARIQYTVLIRTALQLVAHAPNLLRSKRLLQAYESALALDQRRQRRTKKTKLPGRPPY